MPTASCISENFQYWTTLITIVILVIALGITTYQSILMRKANYATAYKVAVDILQAQDIRDARKYVLTVLKSKEYQKWTKKDKETAEKVCQSYDVVGQMVHNKMLPNIDIIDNWYAGLNNSWEILQPLVKDYRIK